MPWQKSVDVHQNPAHTSPTHLSTHSYPTLISKKHHMLTSREKCGLAARTRQFTHMAGVTISSRNRCKHRQLLLDHAEAERNRYHWIHTDKSATKTKKANRGAFPVRLQASDFIEVLVALPGLEPGLFALRGRRVNQLHHNATARKRFPLRL